MTPRQYWTMCRLHDWLYMMSDDPEMYRQGSEMESDLLDIAATDPALAAIYEAWRAYHFESGPKPDEPKLEG